MYKHLIIGAVLLSVSARSFASDTTYRKHPWLMFGSAGYTINKAFGGVMDNEAEFNAMSGIRNAKQKDWGGFELRAGFQSQISSLVYFKTGLGYLQKQVNPEEGGFMLYKDSLKTGYLSFPILFGVIIPVNPAKTILFSVEGGASADFKLIDKTTSGIDRADFSTSSAVVDLQGGCGLIFNPIAGSRAFIQYTYRVDMTDAYKETLYWGAPNEPYRTLSLKYRTQVISLGWIWDL